MRIGEASRATGTSARSLRYYEDEGLIEPGRLDNGFRDYCGSTLERVRSIRLLLDAGLPIRLVADVLPGPVDVVPASAQISDAFLADVTQFRDRLSARIDALSSQRVAVEAFLDRARSGLTLPPV